MDSEFVLCLNAVPGTFTIASCAGLPERFWSVCLARLAATTDFCPWSPWYPKTAERRLHSNLDDDDDEDDTGPSGPSLQPKTCHGPLDCSDCHMFEPVGPRSARAGSVDVMSQCLSLVKRSHGTCSFRDCAIGKSPAWSYSPESLHSDEEAKRTKPELYKDVNPWDGKGAHGRLIEAPWVNVTHQCLALSEDIFEERNLGLDRSKASHLGCFLCAGIDTDDSVQSDCILRSNLTCTEDICDDMREGVRAMCYRNIHGNQDCECKHLWHSPEDGVGCMGVQSCPSDGCDGDLPWCVTVLPCRTEQPQFGGSWAYCNSKKTHDIKWPY